MKCLHLTYECINITNGTNRIKHITGNKMDNDKWTIQRQWQSGARDTDTKKKNKKMIYMLCKLSAG